MLRYLHTRDTTDRLDDNRGRNRGLRPKQRMKCLFSCPSRREIQIATAPGYSANTASVLTLSSSAIQRSCVGDIPDDEHSARKRSGMVLAFFYLLNKPAACCIHADSSGGSP